MAETVEEILRREQLLREAEQAIPHRVKTGEEVLPPIAPVEASAPTPASAALDELTRVMAASREARTPRFETAFGSDATPSERALIELNRVIETKLPGAPQELGTLRGGLGFLNRSIANVAGTALAPVVGPLTRPDPDSEEGRAFARGTGVQRLVNEVGRSQEAAQAFLRRFGMIPSDLPDTPQTLLDHVGADLMPAAIASIALLRGAAFASRYAGSDYLSQLGITAPASATATGVANPVGRAVGQAAAQIQARPVTFTSSIVGSQPFATATREVASPLGEEIFGRWEDATAGNYVGRAVWDFATEAFGGAMASRLGPYVLSRVGALPARENLTPWTIPSQPIASPAANPAEAAGIARVQAVTTIDAYDRMIASAIEHAARPGVTEQAAGIRLHGSLIAARDFAHDTTQRAYARVHQLAPDAQGNPSGLIDEMTELMRLRAQESGGLGQNVDMPYLGELQRQLYRKNADGSLYINPVTSNPQYRTDVTLQEITAIRTELLHRGDAAADSLRAGGQGRRTERELLRRLHDAATTDIERWLVPGSPGYDAWNYANNLYRHYNDRFQRGPVERMLRTGPYAPRATGGVTLQPGQANVPPVEMARQLVKTDETAEAVFNAALRFGLASNTSPALRTAMEAAASGVRTSTEDAIGALFRSELDDVWRQSQIPTAGRSTAPDIPTTYNLSPTPPAAVAGAASRFMAQNEHLLRSWTNVTTDMWNTTTSLNRLLQARNEYTRGIVSQFIGRDIDAVIAETLDSPARVARFTDLYNSLRHNTDALEGVRRAAINRLFHGYGADPNIALQRLQSAQYREALTALFKGDEGRLNRLYDLVRTAAEITGPAVSATARGTVRLDEKGAVQEMSAAKRWLRSATINMAAIFGGLIPGHIFTRIMPGSGSAMALSVPSRMATAARKYVAAAWMRDRVSALEILRDAVFDPQVESYLMMAGPGTWADMRRLYQRTAVMARRAQNAANGDAEEFLAGNWRAAAVRDRRAYFLELERIRRGPFREAE